MHWLNSPLASASLLHQSNSMPLSTMDREKHGRMDEENVCQLTNLHTSIRLLMNTGKSTLEFNQGLGQMSKFSRFEKSHSYTLFPFECRTVCVISLARHCYGVCPRLRHLARSCRLDRRQCVSVGRIWLSTGAGLHWDLDIGSRMWPWGIFCVPISQ